MTRSTVSLGGTELVLESGKLALQAEGSVLGEAGPIEGDFDRAEDRSAERVNHIAVRASGRRHLVDRNEPVVGLDAGEIGGAVRRDRSDTKFLLGRIEGHANAAEPVAGGALIAGDIG